MTIAKEVIEQYAPVKIKTLEFSKRTYNALTNSNIYYLGDLIQFKRLELKALRGIGEMAMGEINKALELRGLALGVVIPADIKIPKRPGSEMNRRWRAGAISPKDGELTRRTIRSLKLPVRAERILSFHEIYYVGDLITRTEENILSLPYFGKKLIGQLKNTLAHHGLSLGMKVPGWPFADLESGPEFWEKLNIPVNEFNFKTKAKTAIEEARVVYFGDLVQLRKRDIDIVGFGPGSLKEITDALDFLGLRLEMKVADWPRPEAPPPPEEQ